MKKTAVLIVTIIAMLIISATVALAQDQASVSEAKLGTGVQDRMITGEGDSFPKDSQVFFWVKISGAASQEVTVTWKSGNYSHETKLNIGGSPWRTWAEKTVRQVGDWTVSVVSSDGTVLKEMSFKVE